MIDSYGVFLHFNFMVKEQKLIWITIACLGSQSEALHTKPGCAKTNFPRTNLIWYIYEVKMCNFSLVSVPPTAHSDHGCQSQQVRSCGEHLAAGPHCARCSWGGEWPRKTRCAFFFEGITVNATLCSVCDHEEASQCTNSGPLSQWWVEEVSVMFNHVYLHIERWAKREKNIHTSCFSFITPFTDITHISDIYMQITVSLLLNIFCVIKS